MLTVIMDNNHRPTKNEKRRNRKKSAAANTDHQVTILTGKTISNASNGFPIEEYKERRNDKLYDDDDLANVEIEYVSTEYDSEMVEQFDSVFKRFSKPEDLMKFSAASSHAIESSGESKTGLVNDSGEGHKALELQNNDMNNKLSKKKKKLMSRLSVAELKQLVQRPDVVEAHDITSNDPRLLVYLKSYRNTVPVPRHWCHKRKYLTGKRGYEKIPYQLPEFIADTGIAKIRETIMEQEALKKSRQKARDKLKPKMGKIDIDYQVLHDAFFKYQTKPKLTIHGEIYYEGKELEVCYLLIVEICTF